MIRAILEYRPTLDDLFGPDLWDELREDLLSASNDLKKSVEHLRQFCDIYTIEDVDHLEGLQERYTSAQGRFVNYVSRFGQRFSMIVMSASLDGQGDFHFEYRLFPGLGHWLRKHLWGLEEEARKGMATVRQALQELRRTLDRLAQNAAHRCIDSIRAAMSKLRDRPTIAIEAGSSTPRELISDLLAPLVLAAGGRSDLFVTRC